jgi:hypothetical protein
MTSRRRPNRPNRKDTIMTRLIRTTMLAGLAIAAGAAGLLWSGDVVPDRGAGLVSEAHAVIGRPLTPMSYAGVARRTVRRCAVGVYYC